MRLLSHRCCCASANEPRTRWLFETAGGSIWVVLLTTSSTSLQLVLFLNLRQLWLREVSLQADDVWTCAPSSGSKKCFFGRDYVLVTYSRLKFSGPSLPPAKWLVLRCLCRLTMCGHVHRAAVLKGACCSREKEETQTCFCICTGTTQRPESPHLYCEDGRKPEPCHTLPDCIFSEVHFYQRLATAVATL